ncbi:MAG: hypothetical protein R2824_19230 [Saprospiraceae bacterium]
MQQKTTLFTLWMLLFSSFAFAQEPQFFMTQQGENKDIIPQHFLGKDGRYFWYLGYEVRQHHNIGGGISPVIFKLDIDLQVVEAHALEVDEKDLHFLREAVLLDNTIYLLVQKDEKAGWHTDIYFDRYDLKGKALQPLTVMDINLKPEIFMGLPVRKKYSASSPDQNWFYFCFYDQNDLGDHPLPLEMSIVNLRSGEATTHRIELKEGKKHVENLQFLGTNNGEALMLYESNYAGPLKRKYPKTKKNKQTYPLNTSKLIKINQAGDKSELILYEGKDFVRTARMKLGNDDFLYYTDLLSIDESNTAQSIYNVKKITPEALEIVKEVSEVFQKEHFSNLDGFDLNDGQYGLPIGAVIQDIFPGADGKMKIIYRHSYLPTLQSNVTTYTFHESIFVLSLKEDGSVEWAVTLPQGLLADARLREGGIRARESDGSLLILFNSVPKIINKTYTEVPKVGEARSIRMNNTTTAYFVIDQKGNYRKRIVFEDTKIAADLGEIGELSDHEFSFPVFSFKKASKPTGVLVKAIFGQD